MRLDREKSLQVFSSLDFSFFEILFLRQYELVVLIQNIVYFKKNCYFKKIVFQLLWKVTDAVKIYMYDCFCLLTFLCWWF
jgi:hypothetical protein